MKILDQVNAEWIQNKMKETGLSQVDISRFTGIDKQTISKWVKGIHLSRTSKVMFYLIFSFSEKVKEKLNK